MTHHVSGGPGCGHRPGGAPACCDGRILQSGRICGQNVAPCELPPAPAPTPDVEEMSGALDATYMPVAKPTSQPVAKPSQPVAKPSSQPVAKPTSQPVATPTSQPVATPTSQPVATPTSQPVATPTREPTGQPTDERTAPPSLQYTTMEPTSIPTDHPIACGKGCTADAHRASNGGPVEGSTRPSGRSGGGASLLATVLVIAVAFGGVCAQGGCGRVSRGRGRWARGYTRISDNIAYEARVGVELAHEPPRVRLVV